MISERDIIRTKWYGLSAAEAMFNVSQMTDIKTPPPLWIVQCFFIGVYIILLEKSRSKNEYPLPQPGGDITPRKGGDNYETYL